MDKNKNGVIKYYNNDENIKRYTEAIETIGLWNTEKVFFEKYVDKSAKILDLGCGAGRTTINLYKNGYTDIIGVDIAENLIIGAQSYCLNAGLDIPFETGDACALAFADNTFDAVIFSYNGMQCIPGKQNRDAALKEIYRVLKPGGIYIFTAFDRDTGKYASAWAEEKLKWENGLQDPSLEMFGDKLIIDPNGDVIFGHFSNIEEMKNFIAQQNFEILEIASRADIAPEKEIVTSQSDSTMFWACRKIK